MIGFSSVDPYSGATVFERAAWRQNQLNQALVDIREVQAFWQALSLHERINRLTHLAQLLAQHRDELVHLISLEVGRLFKETRAEVNKSIALIDAMTTQVPQWLRFREIKTEASLSGVRFTPLGILFAIMPWNFPLWQPLRFAIPALLSGNACWVKPAPSVPQLSAYLEKLATDAGVVALRMAWIDPSEVPFTIEHSDAVAFTGSTKVGRIVGSLAGQHLKKSILELGGSNPMVILDDADLDLAVDAAVMARFRDAGQACNSAKRFIVLPHIAEDFIKAFVTHAGALRFGPADDPNTSLAPMARADLRDALHEQVQDALSHGASCLLGGQHPQTPNFIYPATIIDHIHTGCRLYHEECFGPVASILRARDETHALELANDTPFGLGAAVFSRDIERARTLGTRIRAGGIYINRHMSSHIHLPFGGIKESGYGRELGEFGFYEWLNIQAWWER